MKFKLFGTSVTIPSSSFSSSTRPPSASSSQSTLTAFTSSSSSSTVVVEKDLLTRLSNSNFENSGVDVNLSLCPPSSPTKRCCICGGTSTPLWRNGHQGPKTACNACGIKYRKKMQKLSLKLALASSTKKSGI